MNFHCELTLSELLRLSKEMNDKDAVIYVFDPYYITTNLKILFEFNNVIINNKHMPMPDFNIIKPFIQCVLVTDSINDIANFIFDPEQLTNKINRFVEQKCSRCYKSSNNLQSIQKTLGRASDEGHQALFVCDSCLRL